MSARRIIAGFQLGSPLGSGGGGSVYRATQLSLGRDVAIKLLHKGSLQDEHSVERFLAEAQIAARLKHPGIAQVYECGQENGEYFIAMELINGHNLLNRVNAHGPIDEATALTVGISIGNALQHAWDKSQLVHCDLKPENILIDEDGVVKVVDLGIATMLGMGVISNLEEAFHATPEYVAPEIVRGASPVDFRADIYSLGATLYHVITGKAPFCGLHPQEIAQKHLTGHLVDPRRLAPSTSIHTVNMLRRMMCRNPAERHGTWQELLDDFARVESGKPPLLIVPAKGDSVIEPLSIPESSVLRKVKRGVTAPTSRPSNSTKHAAPRQPSSSSHLGIIFGLILIGCVIGAFYHFGGDGDTPNGQNAPKTNDAAPSPQEQALRDAALFAEANPDRYAEISRRYERVVGMAPGSTWAEQARRSIDSNQAGLERAVQREIRRLEEAVTPLLARSDIPAALVLYKNYAGPFSEQMRPFLDVQISRLQSMMPAAETLIPVPVPDDESLRHMNLKRRLADDVITSYIAILEQRARRLQSSGDLEGVLAYNNEKSRVELEARLLAPDTVTGPSHLRELAARAYAAEETMQQLADHMSGKGTVPSRRVRPSTPPAPAIFPPSARNSIAMDIRQIKTLGYSTAEKKWHVDHGQPITLTHDRDTATVNFTGERTLAKIFWPLPIQIGNTITCEVKGAYSAELIDIAQGDESIAAHLPRDRWIKVALTRTAEDIVVEIDGDRKHVNYISAPLGGSNVKESLLARTSLYFSLTVRQNETIEVRSVRLIQ